MTKKEINKRYFNKYIEISKTYDYKKKEWDYVVNRVYDKIHENTTLGQDVGTAMEYTR